MTALHIAVQWNQLEIVKYLLTQGINSSLKDVNGISIITIFNFTAADYAHESEYNDIYEVLAASEADE